MRSEDEIRTLVRERYGAIAQTAGSCCAPSACGCGSAEMAPDGLDVIGDAYQGVAGRLEEADLRLGCGVPTRHAALRPGGRFCASDIVATGELPAGVRAAAGLYVGCVAGAIPEADYLDLLAKVGFEGVRIVEPKPIELPDEALAPHMAPAEIAAFRASGVALKSVTVLGTKPA